ncbi:MAG: hypothetical protein QM811_31020 [Pirellulales bacterium]
MPVLRTLWLVLGVGCADSRVRFRGAAADEAAPPQIWITRVTTLNGIAWKTESGPDKPFIIANDEELEKAFPKDKAVQAEVKKAVDFAKARLVVFAWEGSGKDRLELVSPDTEKGGNIIFNYKRGATRDLRKHVNVYSLPKDHKFEVAMPK